MADNKEQVQQDKQGNVFTNFFDDAKKDVDTAAQDAEHLGEDAAHDAEHAGGEVVADAKAEEALAKDVIDHPGNLGQDVNEGFAEGKADVSELAAEGEADAKAEEEEAKTDAEQELQQIREQFQQEFAHSQETGAAAGAEFAKKYPQEDPQVYANRLNAVQATPGTVATGTVHDQHAVEGNLNSPTGVPAASDRVQQEEEKAEERKEEDAE